MHPLKTIFTTLITLMLLNPVLPLSGQSVLPVLRSNKTEVVELTTLHYRPEDTLLASPFWDFRDKIWFKDSFAIEEVRQLNIEENMKGITCQSYDILHYRYTNLCRGLIYEFNNFTDSAVLLRKYPYTDSSRRVGGWGFYSTRHWNYQGKTEIMTDTIIDKTLYKRAVIFRTVKGIPYIIYCYFNCDKKGTVFNMDPDLSNTTGCPLTKIYWSTPQKKGLHMTSEVRFLSDTLSLAESKVFAGWEKNTAQNQ